MQLETHSCIAWWRRLLEGTESAGLASQMQVLLPVGSALAGPPGVLVTVYGYVIGILEEAAAYDDVSGKQPMRMEMETEGMDPSLGSVRLSTFRNQGLFERFTACKGSAIVAYNVSVSPDSGYKKELMANACTRIVISTEEDLLTDAEYTTLYPVMAWVSDRAAISL